MNIDPQCTALAELIIARIPNAAPRDPHTSMSDIADEACVRVLSERIQEAVDDYLRGSPAQPSEEFIRASERAKIAAMLHAVGVNLLHDPESDAVDGYVSAVVIDLADTIKKVEAKQ